MKAAVITLFGGPEVLEIATCDIPQPKANEVLIKVYAAGVNRPDIMQRQGKYAPPTGVVPDIPGLEIAGEIVSCGTNTKKWKIGDKVCALIPGGGYAEYAVADEGSCLRIPQGLNFIEAASLPETVFTVWHNVFNLGKLKAGETLLIHGGSSGIGTTAIQIAKAFNTKIFITAGSDEKCEACLQLGADRAINYKKQDFAETLQAEKIDVILDMIGGDYTEKNLKLLNTEGRLVLINAMKGLKSEINLLHIFSKRLVLTGSTLRARTHEFKESLGLDIQKNVWPLIENKSFKPVIYQTFKLEEVVDAHKLMESSKHIGKIVLSVSV